MKNYLLLLTLIFTSLSFGQTRIKFNYDAAGNQTKRYICISGCTAKMEETDSIYRNEETLTETDMIEQDEQLSYYPNPVREELYVKWKNQKDGFISSIEVYSMTGQLVKNYTNLVHVEKQSVAFQNLPEGFYNVVLLYTNGDRKTLKIVKNKS